MVAKTEPVAESPTLTLAELAALERIGMTKALDLARRNAFPFPVLKLGREYRISRKAYERWRDGEKPQPTIPPERDNPPGDHPAGCLWNGS